MDGGKTGSEMVGKIKPRETRETRVTRYPGATAKLARPMHASPTQGNRLAQILDRYNVRATGQAQVC